MSDATTVPMACGLLKPAVILPTAALGWSDEEVRCALLHEREHLRRHDWLVLILARTVAAIYWFHPLTWVAWVKLRLEVERACDDAVVQQADGTAYAAQLVTLARRMKTTSTVPLLSMTSRGDLRARVRALLDPARPRGRAGRPAQVAIAVGLCVVIGMLAPLRVVGVSAAQKGRPLALLPAWDGCIPGGRPGSRARRHRGR
jgi:beta-lactamase regulating signal transducer with metallopeptidase domain